MKQLPAYPNLEKHIKELKTSLYEYWLLPSLQQTPKRYAQYNARYTKMAYGLYQKLIAPLGDLPQKLIIIPDGVLGYIPFETLLSVMPQNPSAFKTHTYLSSNHQISYNYSLSLWQEMKNKKHHNKGLITFAPSFEEENTPLATVNEYRRRNMGHLNFNIKEVDNIYKICGGSTFKDIEASKENFFKVVQNYSIIHLATHAKVDDRNSDFSFLTFSGVTDTTDVGKLYVRDLYNLQIPADMVVLSACETGMGELQKGEGIISLARGFSYAGAKSIITSLWEVNDKATSEIMTDFYKNLQSGDSKDNALQKAKNTYIKKQIENASAHPFFWASFVAVGDMTPLDFGNDSSILWFVSLALVGFLFLLVWLVKRKNKGILPSRHSLK